MEPNLASTAMTTRTAKHRRTAKYTQSADMTPTPARVQQWTDHLDKVKRLSDEWDRFDQVSGQGTLLQFRACELTTADQAQALFGAELTSTQNPRTRAAITYLMFNGIKTQAIEHGVDLSLFDEPLSYQASDSEDEDEDEDENAAQSIGQDDKEGSGMGPDDEPCVAVDEAPGYQVRFAGLTIGTFPDLAPGAPAPRAASCSANSTLVDPNPWDALLIEKGWTSGDGGSRDNALVVGAKTYGRVKYDTIGMSLSWECDAAMADDQQAEFAQALEDMRWQANYFGSIDKWQRLHPFARNAWVQALTTDAIGINGIKKANAIFAEIRAGDVAGPTIQDVILARNCARDPDSNVLIQEVFQSIGDVLQYDQKHGKYTDFRQRVHQCDLWRHIQAMKIQCKIRGSPTRRIVWQSLGQNPDVIGTGFSGCETMTMVKRYIMRRMRWSEADWKKHMESLAPMAKLAEKFGHGICLLMGNDFKIM